LASVDELRQEVFNKNSTPSFTTNIVLKFSWNRNIEHRDDFTLKTIVKSQARERPTTDMGGRNFLAEIVPPVCHGVLLEDNSKSSSTQITWV